ncbi:sushi, von Willebrand factor type A, EGF and pentraxin domain-containing protein 1 [Trichonephila clavipes]|uniref:Sushi, von Willebrand factor type A, EGF and pentraxin domain-containing protein 1 n=1 Tax=Trichonephila clavipes TaxID=2585209 RepID=A0A8X6SRH8_TRICX|nr:sushi, von Willebrand factor type A, EGF and pentraxin domain-containing protein 1 [Trichonephila clavipes]
MLLSFVDGEIENKSPKINLKTFWGGNRLTCGFDYYSSQYYKQLNISNIDEQHNGFYQCFIPEYSPSNITIQVINPVAARCQKLEDEDLLIEYNNEQFVNSSAVFSCKGPNQTLVGSRVLTCIPDGRWSSDKPECKKLCPEIPKTEGMTILYTEDQNIGSIAAFHCFAPRVRTGVSHAICKQNGEWKDPVPTCTSRLVARQLDRFDCVVSRCWDQWIRKTRRPGSGRDVM